MLQSARCHPFGQGFMFQFQSTAGADTKVIRKLSGLRKSSRSQRFVFVLTIPAPFVFDSELDLADDSAFELHFPDVGIRCGRDKIANRVAAGAKRFDFVLVCYRQRDLQGTDRGVLHIEDPRSTRIASGLRAE